MAKIIFSVPSSGTQESTKTITIEDLKDYYQKLSPKNANVSYCWSH